MNKIKITGLFAAVFAIACFLIGKKFNLLNMWGKVVCIIILILGFIAYVTNN